MHGLWQPMKQNKFCVKLKPMPSIRSRQEDPIANSSAFLDVRNLTFPAPAVFEYRARRHDIKFTGTCRYRVMKTIHRKYFRERKYCGKIPDVFRGSQGDVHPDLVKPRDHAVAIASFHIRCCTDIDQFLTGLEIKVIRSDLEHSFPGLDTKLLLDLCKPVASVEIINAMFHGEY